MSFLQIAILDTNILHFLLKDYESMEGGEGGRRIKTHNSTRL